SYLMLAFLYMDLDAEISKDYMVKSKELLPQNTVILWKARNYGSLGNNYRNMDQLDSAIKYMSVHLKMAEENHLNGEIMIEKNRFGYLYMKQAKLDSAFTLINTGLQYFKSIQSYRMIAENYTTLGKIRFRQGLEKRSLREQYLREAETNAMEGLKYATKIGYLFQQYSANKLLSDICAAEGKNVKALDYLRTAFTNYDSIYGARIVSKASALSWKNAEDLKGKQMELLKLHNRQQLILVYASAIGFIILVIVVIVIISSRRRIKKAYLLVNNQKEEIECQKEALESTLDKLKQAQSQLIHSEKMASLGMLTAGIAHEINNPVNFINSGAISLERDYKDLQRLIQSLGPLPSESQKIAEEIGMDELLKIIPQTIEDIKTGVQRTSEIVKGLRNFTRLDASELKEADLHEGIDSNLLLLSHKFKDRIRIVKEYDKRIGSIKCYPGPLNQVFINLFNNAIDALEQKVKQGSSGAEATETQYLVYKPLIVITTKLIDENGQKQVKIEISDNGAGIPEEIRDKLFDPFFTTKEVGKGTGLGLAICHGIIDKHGGDINFEMNVNEGTKFTITLPVY
ncbi:MAG: ATP-binding protein, partial [Bacteroidota bacterium]